jgi:Na+-transporting NADH:ubiquinone oxidoreductase subunit C
MSVEDQFKNLEIRFLDFDTGETYREYKDFDIDKYDQLQSLRFSDQSKPVPADKDIAIIKNRENIGKIYFSTKDNEIDKLILPIRGYGLWGTLYGYISIENDFNTVSGIEFYEHKETPGLGAEVDNPKWKSQWKGKKIYKEDEVSLAVIKGKVDKSDTDASYKIDGLSGATITSRGVSNMVAYWFGESGYSSMLRELNYES